MVAALVALQHALVLAEQLDGVHQQIVKVAGIVGSQQIVVALVDAPHDL